jgi:hypothetical protein
MKTNEPMKNKTRDEDDANQSLFSAAGVRPNHPFSKTTHFADISIRVAGVFVSKRLEVFHDPTSSDLSSDSGYVRRAQEVRQSNATKTASEQAFMAWPNS